MNEDKLVATVEDAMSYVDEARAELRSAYDLIDQYSALVDGARAELRSAYDLIDQYSVLVRRVTIYIAVLAILFSAAAAVVIAIAATR